MLTLMWLYIPEDLKISAFYATVKKAGAAECAGLKRQSQSDESYYKVNAEDDKNIFEKVKMKSAQNFKKVSFAKKKVRFCIKTAAKNV